MSHPLDVEVKFSHRRTWDAPVRAAFKVTLLPIEVREARNLHYIVLLDVSRSMAGEKIEAVRRGLLELAERIPDGNRVTVILFGVREGDGVRVAVEGARVDEATRSELRRLAEGLTVDWDTPLHRALSRALEIAKAYGEPGYLVLISDGKPTDVDDVDAYRRLSIPENIKPIVIGVGGDYREDILAAVADAGGGSFTHVPEGEVKVIPEIFSEVAEASAEAAARDVEVRVESPAGRVELLGYTEPRVRLPVVSEEPVTIYGSVELPPRYSGEALRVTVSYSDPERDERASIVRVVEVEPAASREEYLESIDRSVLDEYLYRRYIEDARRLAAAGNLEEATRRLRSAEKLAEATRRIDLVEQTRRMISEVEQTRRISPSEATKRLISEATRTVRGG